MEIPLNQIFSSTVCDESFSYALSQFIHLENTASLTSLYYSISSLSFFFLNSVK